MELSRSPGIVSSRRRYLQHSTFSACTADQHDVDQADSNTNHHTTNNNTNHTTTSDSSPARDRFRFVSPGTTFILMHEDGQCPRASGRGCGRHGCGLAGCRAVTPRTRAHAIRRTRSRDLPRMYTLVT